MTATQKGNDMQDSFTKSVAIKRVRQVIATQWENTKGFRIEIADLMGCTDPLTNIEPKHWRYDAEFRVLLSTRGRDAELRDMFRMNIGNPTTPAHLVEGK